jgi:hypothetical protein
MQNKLFRMLLILKVSLLANVLGLQTLAQTPLIDIQAEERYQR